MMHHAAAVINARSHDAMHPLFFKNKHRPLSFEKRRM